MEASDYTMIVCDGGRSYSPGMNLICVVNWEKSKTDLWEGSKPNQNDGVFSSNIKLLINAFSGPNLSWFCNHGL